MKARTLVTAVAAIVASVWLAVLVPGASADPGPPVLGAQHALVGDPLFGLDTPEGTLFGIAPDQQTAMASTTKIWTLDLTANFLDQGVVHLDDLVTINAFESSFDKSNSLMTATNGKSLEAGEVVKFRDLIRGMMYQSGNDAAFAIADHIGQALYGPKGDWHDFVALMNFHAFALGQTHTHFTSPNGWDNPNHFTSARDLADQFQHAMQNPFFAKVVGFSGLYTAMTTGAPSGPKTYALTWGNAYPGWEGEKGGSTPNCNGPNVGCDVAAATRIGRRVVISGMQMAASDQKTMFDYGFAKIFNPDPRATSSPVWSYVDKKAIDCWGSGNAVTALLPPSGPVSLAYWSANVDGKTITNVTQASLPGSGYYGRSGSGGVAVSHLPSGDVILATKMGTTVKLSRWAFARGGGLQLLASDIAAGSATTMALQPVYGDTFLTTMTDPTGHLVLKSWRLSGSSLVNLDTYTTNDWTTYDDVSVAGPQTADLFGGPRAVTAARAGTHVYVDSWGVDQVTGKISLLGNKMWPWVAGHVTITSFSPTLHDGELFAPSYYAVGYQNDEGNAVIDFYKIDGSGAPVWEDTTWPDNDVPGTSIKLAPLGTGGVMSAITDAGGSTRLVAWDAHRDADDTITAQAVAEQYTPAASSLDLCRLPGSIHAEGDYLMATKDADGLLRLRAYRSGDRPF